MLRYYVSLTMVLALVLGVVGQGTAETITLQRGLNGYDGVIDTRMIASFANRNYGIADSIRAGMVGNDHDRGIIHFDLSAYAGVAQGDGIFELTVKDNTNFYDRTLCLYVIESANAGWIEGTKNHAVASAGEPTWSHHDYPNAWTGAGGLGTPGGGGYGATPISTVYFASAPAVDSTVALTVPKAVIDAWIATPSDNAGLLLRLDNEATGRQVQFRSSDYGTVAQRPSLTFNLVPEPSTLTLLATGLIGLLCYAWRKQK